MMLPVSGAVEKACTRHGCPNVEQPSRLFTTPFRKQPERRLDTGNNGYCGFALSAAGTAARHWLPQIGRSTAETRAVPQSCQFAILGNVPLKPREPTILLRNSHQ